MNFRKESVIVALLMVTFAGRAIAAPLPTREIKLTGKLLLIPVGSRIAPDGTRNKGNNLRVSVDGVLVHNVGLMIAPTPEEVTFWGYLDMSEYVGGTAKLEVRGPVAEDALALFESSDKERYLKPLYTEIGRPQFHFSQKQGWNNDVNGMVYYDGLYHLSWQCNPVGRSWGNMYWGHAVSRDLVHWDEWPRVLRAGGGATKEGRINDNIHRSMAIRQCFSGSACVDINNTLGKQKGDVKTLIACFTDTGSGLPRGPGEALAYSTDNGRTYTYLKDYNPLAVRYLMISSQYRQPLNFTFEGIRAAQNSLDRLNELISKLGDADGKDSGKVKKEIEKAKKKVEKAMDDDLNTPLAFAALFEFVRATNTLLAKRAIGRKDAKAALGFLKKIDSVFAVMDFGQKKKISAADLKLVRERERLRAEKKWQEADAIRKALAEKGILLDDTEKGTKWKIVK